MDDENERLIARLEAATGPDRELDLAIHVKLWPDGDIAKVIKFRRGFDGREGMAWEIHGEAVCFEKFDAHGRCPYNGGYRLPAYTASIDAALTLVPAWMHIKLCQMHKGVLGGHAWVFGPSSPIHSNLREWSVCISPPENRRTLALALCIAALRARMAERGEG